jgi:hypothetical protein
VLQCYRTHQVFEAMVQTQHSIQINRGHCVIVTNGKKKICNHQFPPPHLVQSRVVHTHTHRNTVKRQDQRSARNERESDVCVRSVMRLKRWLRLMSLIFRTWMRLAATDKHQSWMLGNNKQTNKHTNSFTHDVKVEWDGPRVGAKRCPSKDGEPPC